VEGEGRVEAGMNGEGVRWGLVEEGIGGGCPPY
jgi:hypothetical protein